MCSSAIEFRTIPADKFFHLNFFKLILKRCDLYTRKYTHFMHADHRF